ncbi:NADH:flavin oxidoreductase [Cupriavidus sp. 2TAF22]|uniref:NADH:flavin oxidoreductase n=1 Tax=unclassified Cupriavidus TaxID=2640874 RepID=UPI003F8EAEE8
MSASPLFEPFQCKSLRLKNRIVMAPMTRSFSPRGVPTADVAAYYARRAAAEVGLIVTEGTAVERQAAKNDPDVPDFHGEALPAWRSVVQAVHGQGGVIAPQLWHVGAVRGRHEHYKPQPVDSPSGMSRPGKVFGAPMTEEAIADTVAAFGRAARDAVALGFDAIELHGAHGYLIDQFLWAGTNTRADQWGGQSLAERARFAAAIVRETRRAIGPDVPLIIRLSQWKQQDYTVRLAATPEEMRQWLEPLADAGVDIFHCSQRRFWDAEFDGSDLNFAGWAKKLTGKAVITVGSVGLSGDFIGAFGGESSRPASIEALLERLDRGEFDLVAVGRALLADPEWVVKIKENRTAELGDFERASMATLY